MSGNSGLWLMTANVAMSHPVVVACTYIRECEVRRGGVILGSSFLRKHAVTLDSGQTSVGVVKAVHRRYYVPDKVAGMSGSADSSNAPHFPEIYSSSIKHQYECDYAYELLYLRTNSR